MVTGAGRGLGAGIADALAARGWALGLLARHEPDAPVGSDPARVLTASVDVTDAAAVDRFGAQVAETLGPVDLWINNAGLLGPVDPAVEADPDEVREAVLVNVVGVMYGSATFARLSRRAPRARRVLVNISSGAAKTVYPGWSTYGPTKAAVEHLSRHIAVEEPDLVVCALAPGVVDTDMQARIRQADERRFPAIERFRSLHRDGAWNSPAWIAEHIVALHEGRWDPGDVVARVPDESR